MQITGGKTTKRGKPYGIKPKTNGSDQRQDQVQLAKVAQKSQTIIGEVEDS